LESLCHDFLRPVALSAEGDIIKAPRQGFRKEVKNNRAWEQISV